MRGAVRDSIVCVFVLKQTSSSSWCLFVSAVIKQTKLSLCGGTMHASLSLLVRWASSETRPWTQQLWWLYRLCSRLNHSQLHFHIFCCLCRKDEVISLPDHSLHPLFWLYRLWIRSLSVLPQHLSLSLCITPSASLSVLFPEGRSVTLEHVLST